MSRVVIRDLAKAPVTDRLPGGVTSAGEVTVAAGLEGTSDPIHVHRFRLEAGAVLRWHDLPHGSLIHVDNGAIEVEGERLGRDSVLVVEHGASTEASALEPTELLAFTPAGSASSRAGGHVHLLPSDRVPRSRDFYGDGRVGGAWFADSKCPTCEFWLHETVLPQGGFEVGVHAHTEDEVIVVTRGEIVLGQRALGPGTVIAIAHATLYSFRTGPDGLTFLNFRPNLPGYIPATPDHPTYDEWSIFSSHMPAPAATRLKRPTVPASSPIER